jgi:putative ABC transport system substrate-binding protein
MTIGNRQQAIGNSKKLKLVPYTLYAMLFALCVFAEAQQPTKIPRIGYLSGATAEAQSVRIGAFRQGLRELGYVEGKNIVIDYRYAEEKLDRLPALAAELVGLKVDVIVTGGAVITRAAKNATNAIPIVMAQDSDPVANGFIASLARPGGNITGLSNLAPELSGKQLELLKEVIPKLSRVAVFGTSSNSPGNAKQLREIELAAGAFEVNLQYVTVISPTDIETGFRAATRGRADAVVVQSGPIFNSHRAQIVKLAVKSRLPAIYSHSQYVIGRGTYDLRRELARLGPARRYLCGQDFERCQARRFTGGAADEI